MQQENPAILYKGIFYSDNLIEQSVINRFWYYLLYFLKDTTFFQKKASEQQWTLNLCWKERFFLRVLYKMKGVSTK